MSTKYLNFLIIAIEFFIFFTHINVFSPVQVIIDYYLKDFSYLDMRPIISLK